MARRLTCLSPVLSCIVKEPGGTQKRKWRITFMRHVRRLQRKSVSQGILSLGLRDVTSYVRYDGGFALTRAAVSSARISLRAFLSNDSDSYLKSRTTLTSRFARINDHWSRVFEIRRFAVVIVTSDLSQLIECLKNVIPNWVSVRARTLIRCKW